jgi:valyl-tRNA synthetase
MMGDVPFTDVIIHSTVLAPDGRRMSKSLGTGIDPLDVIAEHGADATRYGLLKMSSTQDVRFSYGAVEEGRKLANKLWNVSRLMVGNVGNAQPEVRASSLEERWMIARLDALHSQYEQTPETFDFGALAAQLYRVTFDDFCDWYAEAIKPRLYGGDDDARATALALLERLLKYVHPVMPHVTEEIWSHLPNRQSRLIVAPWPESAGGTADTQAVFEVIQNAAEMYRRSGVRVPLDEEQQRIFDAVVRPDRTQVNGDVDAERERLRKEIARAEGMLGNERFVENAPPEVVEGEREKLARYRRELDALGE